MNGAPLVYNIVTLKQHLFLVMFGSLPLYLFTRSSTSTSLRSPFTIPHYTSNGTEWILILISYFFFQFTDNPKDWSDHALWWPTKNIWLTRTRSTLDQVGLHADALLHFTPMHKILRVQVSKIDFIGQLITIWYIIFLQITV